MSIRRWLQSVPTKWIHHPFWVSWFIFIFGWVASEGILFSYAALEPNSQFPQALSYGGEVRYISIFQQTMLFWIRVVSIIIWISMMIIVQLSRRDGETFYERLSGSKKPLKKLDVLIRHKQVNPFGLFGSKEKKVDKKSNEDK